MNLYINGIVQEQAYRNRILYPYLASPFVLAMSLVHEFIRTKLQLKIFRTGVVDFIGPDGFFITSPEIKINLGDSIAVSRRLEVNVRNKLSGVKLDADFRRIQNSIDYLGAFEQVLSKGDVLKCIHTIFISICRLSIVGLNKSTCNRFGLIENLPPNGSTL
ncbi:hypothetical protein D3C81_1621010 [compost metagenome]